MDLSYLFTAFDGRISRKPYWIGAIIIAVVMIVASFVFGLALGPSLVGLVLTLLAIYPATALMVKRLNDRDRPSWWVIIFWAPSIITLLGQLIGVTHSVETVGGTEVMMPNTFGWVINVVAVGVGIWALIELGILRGTAGPNQHGPDPLGGE